MRFTRDGVERRIAINPELKAAEAYMDGDFVMEDSTIHDLMLVIFRNKSRFDKSPNQIFWQGIDRKLRRLYQNNSLSRAIGNVQSHYDIGDDIYRLFLDKDMQYSCAYFPTGNETLEQAQTAKKRHLAAKLQLKDGQRLLDIGCGWGGLALYMAHVAKVEVVGITLSEHQLEVARKRAEILGVSDRVRFELRDYREIQEPFDRIVSVGMLEHVGVQYLKPYFMAVRDQLKPDGVALIHSISGKGPPGVTGPFLRKYIFPGGYAPSLSEAVAAVELSGLWSLDCEIWRCHYGYTLHHWRERFAANREAASAIMDERFCRMWEIYLSMCECAFLEGSSNVFQLQLARKRDAVPITRDYIAIEEARIERLEAGFVDRVADTAFAALEADARDRAPAPAQRERTPA
ncbi:cyclopropane-fatty-acyl-phospholipid synthase [Hoeflea marina]|uniref:Cyclopropane-fatty-acyl-phospholipid synthase n=1 Tax=Hoeflea marina TaxID=274592 RepID=A0A317PPB1_9HYPH|nr:cyclopropane-fatty-acyl-phospholipid synthase family protein [Hoeflea marina]PWW03348.1 cyclopropane-fatty-acyl-phospholipid synthase [Hoeflea marina]